MKDTGANILHAKEFAVNLVSEDLAAAMNLTCIDAPAGIDELALARAFPDRLRSGKRPELLPGEHIHTLG